MFIRKNMDLKKKCNKGDISVKHKNNSYDNFKRGTTEMLVLHLLQKGDLYGYEITQTLKEKSGGEHYILEGSLYTILFRMVENGYISDYINLVGKKRQRRYYHIEEKGKKRYIQLLNEYDKVCKNVNMILGRTIEQKNIKQE